MKEQNSLIFLLLLMPLNSGASWRQSCWMWVNFLLLPQGRIGDPWGRQQLGVLWTVLEVRLCSSLNGWSGSVSSQPWSSLQIRRHDPCLELCRTVTSHDQCSQQSCEVCIVVINMPPYRWGDHRPNGEVAYARSNSQWGVELGLKSKGSFHGRRPLPF